ncbi:MAG TPA: FAD-dependent oxidoreductase [Terriglobia bacterium]|nr:FAD-dependent oxidoreductase [Terriglobia bacterium]
MARVDVLIYGGGIAGLWTLALLRHAGYSTLLLENSGLGAGQTIQSQGIIHGGLKYALPGVGDRASAKAIREMPARWQRSLEGLDVPDLSTATVHSQECLFWIPSGSRLSVNKMVSQIGLQFLRAKPREVPKASWPAILSTATKVYAAPEPVLDTGSLLSAIATANSGWVRLHDKGSAPVNARVTVLTAGKGNADLLQSFGHNPNTMQLRPLGMIMLKGALPRIYGHCVEGGKAALTITSHPWQDQIVWQIGGEIAERYANESDYVKVRMGGVETLESHFPDLDMRKLQIATYRAVRAEAATSLRRRPSAAQVMALAPHLMVAWPTKLALAPVLAEKILSVVSKNIRPSGVADVTPPDLPIPSVAPYPWEHAQWFSAR